MANWKYWRWQVIRTLPLAVSVAALFGTAGAFAINAFPMAFTASTRIVLERHLNLPGTSTVQRTTAEVQHLQLLIHAMNALPPRDQTPPPFGHRIETARDKPTYLKLTVAQPSQSQAITSLQSLSNRVQEQSEAIQIKRENASVAKFQARANYSNETLKASRDALAEHQTSRPSSSPDELRKTAAMLRRRLLETPTNVVASSQLTKLYTELEIAKGVYSDAHPKVRFIRAKIERAQGEGKPEDTNTAFRTSIVRQLELIDAAIAEHVRFQTQEHRLTQRIDTVSLENNIAQDNLLTALQAIEINHIRLKVVDGARQSGRDPVQVRKALLTLLAFLSVSAGILCLTLSIRFDTRLRRPDDLYKKLGLTPFATLPDLGPSLA